MSKLERLLEELCPDGVEYVCLKTIAEIGTGSSNTNEQLEMGKYPFFVRSPIIRYKDNYEFDEEAIITSGDGVGVGKIYHYINGKYALHQRAYRIHVFSENLSTKFLFYYMKTKFYNYILEKSVSSSVTSIRKNMLENFLIPLLPLPVQEEIVRILDSFTEKTNELKAKLEEELEARKKQYEWYRDNLLKFDDLVPMVKLGDIATDIYRGSGIKRDEVLKEGTPCVRYGEIYTSYDVCFDRCISHTSENFVKNPKYFEYGDILFAITGESVDEIAKSIVYLGEKKCMAGGDIVVLKHKQNPRYMSYVLSTAEAQLQKSKGKIKSKVVHSSVPSLKEIIIPLPSLDIQEKLASILDNFHMLCNDISEGLPAEIDARQKQYEYYRDKLLTFKRLEDREGIEDERV